VEAPFPAPVHYHSGRAGKPSNWRKSKAKSITQRGIEGIASRHRGRVEHNELSLFDLLADPVETTSVAEQHPQFEARLKRLAEPIRDQLGNSLQGVQGGAVRAAGWVD